MKGKGGRGQSFSGRRGLEGSDGLGVSRTGTSSLSVPGLKRTSEETVAVKEKVRGGGFPARRMSSVATDVALP